MPAVRWFFPCFLLALLCQTSLGYPSRDDGPSLALPQPGAVELRCITPVLLELTLITSKQPDPAPVRGWDFVGVDGQLHLPAAGKIVVTVGGTNNPVISVGFRRRVVYAPLKERDLRIGNYLYLKLANPIAENHS